MELLESIFGKTMGTFEDYTCGLTCSDKICLICRSSGYACMYQDYKEWLLDWASEIICDLNQRIIYLTKREYLAIRDVLVEKEEPIEQIKIIEDYLCNEEEEE